jgi:hypothetical protein
MISEFQDFCKKVIFRTKIPITSRVDSADADLLIGSSFVRFYAPCREQRCPVLALWGSTRDLSQIRFQPDWRLSLSRFAGFQSFCRTPETLGAKSLYKFMQM